MYVVLKENHFKNFLDNLFIYFKYVWEFEPGFYYRIENADDASALYKWLTIWLHDYNT